eukprot:12882711-Prorocentrum_lima.AAC.1
MRPTLANKFTVRSVAATQLTATPIAAGVEGVTRKSCLRFATHQGLGRRCQYEHPKDCPGNASSVA